MANDLASLMAELAAALPEYSQQQGRRTIREVSITLREDGTWECLAGGHFAVALGEWQGDFNSEGKTAEIAIENCLRRINTAVERGNGRGST